MSEAIAEELFRLQNDDGLIVPETVYDWALAHPELATHGAINWDQAWNAKQNILNQIRGLVTLHIRYEDQTPRMISLSIDRADRGGYREIETVVATPHLRETMLHDALQALERLQLRFGELAELAPIWEAVRLVKYRPRGRSGRGRRREDRPEA